MKRIYTILICLGVGICLIFAGISVSGLNEVSNFNFLRSWNFRWHYKSADNIQYRSSSSVDRLEINVHKEIFNFLKKIHFRILKFMQVIFIMVLKSIKKVIAL